MIVVVIRVVRLWNAVGEEDATERNEVEPEGGEESVQESVNLPEEPPAPRQLRWVHIDELRPPFCSKLHEIFCSLLHALNMLLLLGLVSILADMQKLTSVLGMFGIHSNFAVFPPSLFRKLTIDQDFVLLNRKAG